MGKRSSLCFRRRSSRPPRFRKALVAEEPPTDSSPPPANSTVALTGGTVGKKKGAGGGGGGRKWMWMRFDRAGQSEILECEKSAIVQRFSIPARDLRILGLSHGLSQSSNILAREKATVINLEFIKAIVTAEEVLILDPLRQEILPFVGQLRQQLPRPTRECGLQVGDSESHVSMIGRQLTSHEAEETEPELPFEFRVLEIALQVVCMYLDSNVAALERDAYPVLDDLARNVSRSGLELVRTLKSRLTRLLSRVQKVRDEIEHLLDDDEDMEHLYLTRKWIQNHQTKVLLESRGSNSADNSVGTQPSLRRVSSNRTGSLVTSNRLDDNNVEDVEMLLEAYFLQLDGTRNKIVCVKEYIEDTEDYVNIRLGSQRNELISLQLILIITALPVTVMNGIVGMFSMNIPCPLYNINGVFGYFVGGNLVLCSALLAYLLNHARRKRLIGP